MSFRLTLVLPPGVDSPRLAGEIDLFGEQKQEELATWELPDSPDPDRLKLFHDKTELRSVYEFGATRTLIDFCYQVLRINLIGEIAKEGDVAICANGTLKNLVSALAACPYEPVWQRQYNLAADDLLAFGRFIAAYAALGAYIISDAA
jgi:hypothetical protein